MSKKKLTKNKKAQKKAEKKELTEKEFLDKLKTLIEKDDTKNKKESKISGKDKNNLRNIDFEQPLSSAIISEAKAPVLERIAGQQSGPVFISRFFQSSQNSGANSEISENNGAKYLSGEKNANEPKYISYESGRLASEILPIDVSQAGRKRTEYIPNQIQNDFFQRGSELKQMDFESQMQEKTWTLEGFDVESAGRKNPIEAEQEKYKSYKPNMPKS